MSKRLVLLASAVSLALVAVGCGGGGSSSGSSEWSDSDVAKVETKIAHKITEEGLTPTKDETRCIVKGLEPMVSASEVLGDAPTDSQQQGEVEELTTNCLGDSAAQVSESDPLEGLKGCEEDPNSSLCVEEAYERGLENIGEEGSEESGAESEGYEEENQGLNEMNEELQQEYEEEGVSP